MDLTREEEGAQITAASSFDANFPPNNILDGDNATKWITTGSFPHEVIVQFATAASISRVNTWSCNVKEVLVEICAGSTPTKWVKLYETKIPESDGNMQIESENVRPGEASFIKFKILSGWNDFVSLHRVSVEGSAARR